jgi:hypothetical protein
MSSNVEYSVGQYEGSIVARSKVKSFNLDHVVDKDITSYYRHISSQALFDTGLLPLNGTGILAIRSAGRHVQIAFQHAPGVSYINWGSYEGDASAKAYNLAQPYRIWIADLIDGNLYGARMFYSPYPITSPDSQLYHLNLPNTNCRGYRGNGVGWICLYHNEDWSNLSFNTKLQKLIERCSGVEAYNDQNMSETDGPRFYQKNNKPEYLWNPQVWQQKTFDEGYEWTLNEDLWIPILVNGIDDQDRHVENGQPLTFAMALLGKYNSYYNDDIHPKLVNAFARPDVDIPVNEVFSIFKQAHAQSNSQQEHFNQMSALIESREKIATTKVAPQPIAEENTFYCVSCEDTYSADEHEVYHMDGEAYCEGCFQEEFVYCENTDNYLHHSSDYLVYIEQESIYIDSSEADVHNCDNCGSTHWKNTNASSFMNLYEYVTSSGQPKETCSECLIEVADIISDATDQSYIRSSCLSCSTTTVLGIHQLSHHFFPISKLVNTNVTESYEYTPNVDLQILETFNLDKNSSVCRNHAHAYHYCPSGSWTTSQMVSIVPWISPAIPLKYDSSKKVILKINAVSSVVLNKDYDENCVHPFKNDIYYYQALAAVYHGLTLHDSPHYEIYNEDGTVYDFSPF